MIKKEVKIMTGLIRVETDKNGRPIDIYRRTRIEIERKKK